MNPLINILIRTGKRPELFKRCLKSISEQTYKNLRIIVSTDGYVIKGIETLTVTPNKKFPYFWNLYCNDLKDEVKDGWFFYLDDDDILNDSKSIAGIVPHLTDESEAVICQFQRWQTKKPSDLQIRKGEIMRGMIGMPCIFLHHTNKNIAQFDGYPAADYRFIKTVSEKIKTKFVHHVVVRTVIKSNGK